MTGDVPGWLPVGDGPDDKWFRESVLPDTVVNCGLLDGNGLGAAIRGEGRIAGCRIGRKPRGPAGTRGRDSAWWSSLVDVEAIVPRRTVPRRILDI